MATPPKSTVLTELSTLMNGLEKHRPPHSFIVSGTKYPWRQVIAELRALLASGTAVVHARGALTDALKADRKLQASKTDFLNVLRLNLRTAYSHDMTTLAAFGLAPVRKRAPPTTDELILRTTKSLATRKERRTMGKRQRAAIKGKVTGVLITPIVGPSKKGPGGNG
jgi:hypothetical protein